MKECPQCRHCYDDSYLVCPLDDEPLISSIAGDVVISGRYILEKRLGKGGMGIVFKAKHKFLKSSHAIKIILPDLVNQNKDLLVRFRQEAILAASINHPNVIRVTDFGVEDETMPYLVMEFVDGDPLSSFLEENKPLPAEKAFEFFQPLALGVAEAHRQGIIHRDLKPDNIIVQKDLPFGKAVKVLDFGLAKIKSVESFGSLVQAQTISVMGSPHYMSPEQWENDKVDYHTDIYALGVLLFQMLTGTFPFYGDTIPSVMYKHLMSPPPSFASLGVSLSPQIEAVISKALEKKRENRPASLREMLYEFEKALAKSGISIGGAIDTGYLPQPSASKQKEPLPATGIETQPFTTSQSEKLYSYLDSSAESASVADQHLAREFFQARDRAEEAKVKVVEADRLVQEFDEAQKLAEEAQERALQAKMKIEADVRRRVEAEMEDKMAAEQQARQKAEALRLAEEAEARKKAEERANRLAEAALEAQKIAEQERKNREREAHQRELEESVRRRAESAALELAEQVEDAKKKYEEAKEQADYEAALRIAAEAKRQKIEGDLEALAESEAERRKLVESEARRQIEEQASFFEKEASAAQQRVEEAKQLAELEAQKREQAEAAQLRAEEEARRLAEEIIEVQKHIEEMKRQPTAESEKQTVISSDFQSPESPVSANPTNKDVSFDLEEQTSKPQQTDFDIPPVTTEIQTPILPEETFSHLSKTNSIPKRKISVPLLIISISALFLTVTVCGYGIYFLSVKQSEKTDSFGKSQKDGAAGGLSAETNDSADVNNERVLIQGGSFMMGRNDIPDKTDDRWGNQFPAHLKSVTSFYLGKTEISNKEYAEFVQATGYPAPVNWNNGKPPAGQEKFPVTLVSLIDAKAYADWISKREGRLCRLPTEEEWEFAARNGAQQTSFPWGNDWRADAANLATQKMSEVGTFRDETLTGGVKDMLGSVIEWTSSKYALYPKHPGGIITLDQEIYVARGGSFGELEDLLEKASWMLTQRQGVPAGEKSVYIGFRLICQP